MNQSSQRWVARVTTKQTQPQKSCLQKLCCCFIRQSKISPALHDPNLDDNGKLKPSIKEVFNLFLILDYLSMKDLIKVGQVSRGFYWLTGHKLILDKFQVQKSYIPQQLIMKIDEMSETKQDAVEQLIQESGILLGQPSAAMLQAAQKIRSNFRNGQPSKPLRIRNFRRRANTGLYGPRYQFFKREMDKRFIETYGEKIKQHRLYNIRIKLKKDQQRQQKQLLDGETQNQNHSAATLSGYGRTQQSLIIQQQNTEGLQVGSRNQLRTISGDVSDEHTIVYEHSIQNFHDVSRDQSPSPTLYNYDANQLKESGANEQQLHFNGYYVFERQKQVQAQTAAQEMKKKRLKSIASLEYQKEHNAYFSDILSENQLDLHISQESLLNQKKQVQSGLNTLSDFFPQTNAQRRNNSILAVNSHSNREMQVCNPIFIKSAININELNNLRDSTILKEKNLIPSKSRLARRSTNSNMSDCMQADEHDQSHKLNSALNRDFITDEPLYFAQQKTPFLLTSGLYSQDSINSSIAAGHQAETPSQNSSLHSKRKYTFLDNQNSSQLNNTYARGSAKVKSNNDNRAGTSKEMAITDEPLLLSAIKKDPNLDSTLPDPLRPTIHSQHPAPQPKSSQTNTNKNTTTSNNNNSNNRNHHHHRLDTPQFVGNNLAKGQGKKFEFPHSNSSKRDDSVELDVHQTQKNMRTQDSVQKQKFIAVDGDQKQGVCGEHDQSIFIGGRSLVDELKHEQDDFQEVCDAGLLPQKWTIIESEMQNHVLQEKKDGVDAHAAIFEEKGDEQLQLKQLQENSEDLNIGQSSYDSMSSIAKNQDIINLNDYQDNIFVAQDAKMLTSLNLNKGKRNRLQNSNRLMDFQARLQQTQEIKRSPSPELQLNIIDIESQDSVIRMESHEDEQSKNKISSDEKFIKNQTSPTQGQEELANIEEDTEQAQNYYKSLSKGNKVLKNQTNFKKMEKQYEQYQALNEDSKELMDNEILEIDSNHANGKIYETQEQQINYCSHSTPIDLKNKTHFQAYHNSRSNQSIDSQVFVQSDGTISNSTRKSPLANLRTKPFSSVVATKQARQSKPVPDQHHSRKTRQTGTSSVNPLALNILDEAENQAQLTKTHLAKDNTVQLGILNNQAHGSHVVVTVLSPSSINNMVRQEMPADYFSSSVPKFQQKTQPQIQQQRSSSRNLSNQEVSGLSPSRQINQNQQKQCSLQSDQEKVGQQQQQILENNSLVQVPQVEATETVQNAVELSQNASCEMQPLRIQAVKNLGLHDTSSGN